MPLATSRLHTVNDAIKLIKNGNILAIHGDKELLKKLPKGNWFGGTIPYFMDITGGLITEDKLFIEDLSKYVKQIHPKMYEIDKFKEIYHDNKNNNFTYMIIPGLSIAHLKFAQNIYFMESAFNVPTYGWIAGFNLERNNEKALVFNGISGEYSNEKILATHCDFFNKEWQLKIDIINIFETNSSNKITFDANGFEVETAFIDGKKVNFNNYLKANNINTKNPLAANYDGSLINVSYKGLENNKVQFYAPVFAGVEYKFTHLKSDYVKAYNDIVTNTISLVRNKFLSCSCILHYLYGELNDQLVKNSDGPFTFGEIAYVLLNQTLVYTTIVQ